MSYIVKIDGNEYKLNIKRENNYYKIFLNKKEIHAEIFPGDNFSRLTLIIDNKSYDIVFDSDNRISVNEEEYTTEVFDEQIQKLIKAGPEAVYKKEFTLTSPMPGLIIEVEVKEGESVKAGYSLLIIEAMKMQNEMTSSKDGVVRKIFCKKGQTVNSGDTLITIE